MANELMLLGTGSAGVPDIFAALGTPLFSFIATGAMLNGSGVPPTNGQTVGTGRRFLGTLGDLTQAVDGSRPTATLVSTPSGDSALTFNGTSSTMDISNSLDAVRNVSAFSGVFVVNIASLAADNNFLLASRNGGAGPRWAARVTSTGAVLLVMRSAEADAGGFVASSAGAVTTGAYRVIHYAYDYVNAKGSAWVNGVNVINAATPTGVTAAATPNTASMYPIALGKETLAARWVNGSIAAFALHQSLYTSGQVTASYSAIRARFGL